MRARQWLPLGCVVVVACAHGGAAAPPDTETAVAEVERAPVSTTNTAASPPPVSASVLRERARVAVGIDVGLTPALPTAWPPSNDAIVFVGHRIEPLPTGVVRYRVLGPTHHVVVPVHEGDARVSVLDGAAVERGTLSNPGQLLDSLARAEQALVEVVAGTREADGARPDLMAYCTWARGHDPRAHDARAAAPSFFTWLGC